MTCIVGVVDGNRVVIGGDSAGVGGLHLQIRKDPKVFRNGPFLFGCTSSFRMIQLLQYAFVPPPHHPPELDDSAFMATAFVNAVRDCLKDGGFAAKDRDVESGGTFLVAYRGRLYEVADDYQVGEMADPYNAVGCGYSYALGSLYATEGQDAEARVTKALEAAERHNAGVRGPWVIEVQTEEGSGRGEFLAQR